MMDSELQKRIPQASTTDIALLKDINREGQAKCCTNETMVWIAAPLVVNTGCRRRRGVVLEHHVSGRKPMIIRKKCFFL